MRLFLLLGFQAWLIHGFLPRSGLGHADTKILTKFTTTTFLNLPKPCGMPPSSPSQLSAEEQDKGFLEFLSDPYPTTIPPEMKDEIYRAEGNTAAAKERQKRITGYIVLCIAFVAIAFFNAFLTEIRDAAKPENLLKVAELNNVDPSEVTDIDISDLGFGWVERNPFFSFFLMNKVGGYLALFCGVGAGAFVEAEFESRRKNAELIWKELERRKKSKSRPAKKKQKEMEKKKKKRSGKQAKRLGALSEVITVDEPAPVVSEVAIEEEAATKEEPSQPKEGEDKKEGAGMFGKIKDFYKQADSMAASQALLLNKGLEEKGIVDKITDESGLKVIGKDAAAKLRNGKDEEKKE